MVVTLTYVVKGNDKEAVARVTAEVTESLAGYAIRMTKDIQDREQKPAVDLCLEHYIE